jgi:hypothetical protein
MNMYETPPQSPREAVCPGAPKKKRPILIKGMYVVTVADYSTSFFMELAEAVDFAELKASTSARPRVVVHHVESNEEYANNYLSVDEHAIKIFNDH